MTPITLEYTAGDHLPYIFGRATLNLNDGYTLSSAIETKTGTVSVPLSVTDADKGTFKIGPFPDNAIEGGLQRFFIRLVKDIGGEDKQVTTNNLYIHSVKGF